MNPFRQKIEELADQAKNLHERERETSLESHDLVAELLRRNAGGYLFLDTPTLAKRIGLSPDQFMKRSQAAKVVQRFPAFRELLESGQTTVSNLRLIAPRVTEANARYFLEAIRGKSARQVARLVKGIDVDGRSLMSKDRRQADALTDRALEVARSRGRLLTRDALVREALEHWLLEWDEPAATWQGPRAVASSAAATWQQAGGHPLPAAATWQRA